MSKETNCNNLRVIPTMFNCFRGDCIPGLLCHHHHLEQINFIDFMFTYIVKIYIRHVKQKLC